MILRTNILYGCLLMGLLLVLSPGASAEPEPDEDYGMDGLDGHSEDIYEPAQVETEVEADHHRNSVEEDGTDLPAHTETSLSMEQDMSTMRPLVGFNTMSPYSGSGSGERDESTVFEAMADAPTQKRVTKVESPTRSSHDYYYEEGPEDEQHVEVATTTARIATTMIPEYVRKSKAERFPQKDQEHDSSDYVEEEPVKTMDEDQYHVEQHQPFPQAQVQQLPSRSKPNPFKPATEDYYYDEIHIKPDPTTTTTTTTSTTQEPLPVLHARFGGFNWPSTQAPVPAITSSPSTTTTTTTTTSTSISTTTPTPRKQPKHIQVTASKPELLPADQLRNYIKDVYIRMPLAVIVDPSSASLEQAKRLYIDALQDKNINIKIVLVTLNAAGAPSAFSFNNTREFIAGLNSTKEHEGGNSFVGVLHAAELVPYDSAVFISTAAIPPHTDLVQDAAITLLKKRIRLFLLWYGEQSVIENETEDAVGGILGEVAIRSGGEIIHIVSTEHGQHIAGNTLTLVADAFRGDQELELPVDTTLSSLHVRIDANMRRATMETPNGEINLRKLVKFGGTNATATTNSNELDAYVPLNKLRKATIFKLKLNPELNSEEPYNVFIRAERKADVFLGDIIKRIDSYYKNGQVKPSSRLARIQFPEKEREKLEEDTDEPKNEIETFSETEIQSSPSLNQTLLAASTGQQRSTLNAMLQQRCGTKIELSTQSQLLVTAGQTATLLFEVTNMRTETVYSTIQVTDERRFLVNLNPTRLNLGPQATSTVRLTVLVPTGTAQGTTDRITFTNYGRETATMAVNLKVVSSIDAQDTTGPTLSWEFGSRCDYVTPESLTCGERFWTLDLTAQDWQSGIMRLQTTPAEGLFYRNYYTAGSTEPLKATYMASCCEPKVAITAYDASGNQRSINIDVRDVVLTEGAIAAICLGAILLLLLIIAIIWGIVWCCRRRKVSLELPTYRSHSTRSME
ncbi:uncharacterized protein [Drosophila pseudoobscura]|uniref:Uncharacterized protein isoform X1 n=1 Tax=Drosophila pseudoobscura pseudoobscura TaxID=46245 RepID=A0A6I8UXB6_DROPS|nr:uncharacterized protein LOC6902871 isoform X1 [Drosophila pseudoobscura]XP_015035894.2 uncharacterized protein LOC6902871 isoform X1 [Drosophila pseudoobscura]XP_015035896.2 uncharacterized protein LOC6902871 isoform X1 [Drosophila pseudoobscura]